MLNVFRENLRHLKWILLAVVFSFILTIFAVWGGGLSQMDSGVDQEAPWAARVGGQVISVQAFQREARNLEATYRQVLGAQYDQQKAFLRVGTLAASRLVDQELLTQEANRAGLTVSGQEVAEAIMRDPAFQQNGAFVGRERYQQMYRSNPTFFQELEREVGRQLLTDKLRAAIEESVSVGEAEIRQTYAQQNEKVSVEYLRIDDSRLPAASPTDRQVEDYYRSHLADYSSGEGRTGRYLLFDEKSIAAGLTVPEAEVHSEYLQGQKSRFTVPEKRRASHILVKLPPQPTPEQLRAAEAKIAQTRRRLESGQDFARVAREVSEDSTASAGGDLSFFSRDQMVREFADAVWSLQVGKLSGTVRTPFGLHLIRLTEIQPGRELSLEEARPQIVSGLKSQRARAEAQRRAEEFAAKVREKGGDFAAAAREAKVNPVELAAVYRGGEVPGLGIQRSFSERLFTLKPGETGEPVPVSAGVAVVQFLAASPSAPLPLDKVRDRARADLLKQMHAAAAGSLFQSAGGTANLAATARKLKLELKTAGPVARGGSLPELGADAALMERLFALKPGEVLPPAAVPGGVAVIRVVSHPDPMEGFDGQRETVRNSLLLGKRDRIFRAYLEQLRAAHPVEINSTLVEQVDRI